MAEAFITGLSPEVARLCEALGLDHVTRLEIIIDAREPVQIRAYQYIGKDQFGAMVSAVEDLRLKAVPDNG